MQKKYKYTYGNDFYNFERVIIFRNGEDGFSYKYYILFFKKYIYRESFEVNMVKCYYSLSLGGGYVNIILMFSYLNYFIILKVFFKEKDICSYRRVK